MYSCSYREKKRNDDKKKIIIVSIVLNKILETIISITEGKIHIRRKRKATTAEAQSLTRSRLCFAQEMRNFHKYKI